jgi:hypothetical protein
MTKKSEYVEWWMKFLEPYLRKDFDPDKFRCRIRLLPNIKYPTTVSYVIDKFDEGDVIRIWLGVILVKFVLPKDTWQYKLFHK